MTGKHLLFYDGVCGLCDKIVQILLAIDSKQQFVFAPLQGETAKKLLSHLPDELKGEDSLVLVENYASDNPSYYLLGKGAFRILWLVGGFYMIPGAISFLPGFLYNWGYRFIAKRRHLIFSSTECKLPDPSEKHRFLP